MIFQDISPLTKGFLLGLEYSTGILINKSQHIKASSFTGADYMRNTFILTYKPGDAVEIERPDISAMTDRQQVYSNTLLLDPGCLYFDFLAVDLKIHGIVDIYIPYATSIDTFNADWKETSDHSDDNYVYEQHCFSSDGYTHIHVNNILYAYMNNHLNVWGNIIDYITSDCNWS